MIFSLEQWVLKKELGKSNCSVLVIGYLKRKTDGKTNGQPELVL